MIAAFSEASFRDTQTINGRELHRVTETARLFGCRILPLPPADFVDGQPENALAYVPDFEPHTLAVWIGYTPSSDWYVAIYEAALVKGVQLINSPAEHLTALEFDRAYPLLAELTPASRVIRSTLECPAASAELGFPLFVKGAVKSNKEQGWNACVAQNDAELSAIVQGLLGRERRSRGKVIVRRLAPIRRVAEDAQGFRLGREYRVFMHEQTMLALGFYWEELSDSELLSDTDRMRIERLAREANRRLDVPFIAIDVAQLENGEWIIIEVNDSQFAGLSQVPVLELWGKLKDIGSN